MNSPGVIWSFLAACALLIVGAMAWSTQKTLDLEARQEAAEAEAIMRERIRLSLATMDTAAAGMLVLENQRPPHHFESFFEPEDIFTSEFRAVGKGIVVQPSPLLGNLPDFVRLHFEVTNLRQVQSPQVPTGNERDLAEQSGIEAGFINQAAEELSRLQVLLEQPPVAAQSESGTNLDMLCATCLSPALANWTAWNLPGAQQLDTNNRVNSAELVNPGEMRRSKTYQDDISRAQKTKRAEGYSNTVQQAVKGQPWAQSEADPAAGAPPPVAPQTNAQTNAQVEGGSVPQSPDPVQQVALVPSPADLHPEVTPFRPVWMAGQLFAIRQIGINGSTRYQGVWLDAPALAAHLCEEVQPYLQHARLEPLSEISISSIGGDYDLRIEEIKDDPLALVTLPWRLDPGEAAVVSAAGWSPLRMSLTVGWVALLLALVAAAFLVRGVMRLSDRRATFVSSVTHELRTPLTTFHLYSDMLAEGMVKDEEKRKSYLETMRREATRLNHLIENVLAYSRIERGSARAQHEQISLGGLVERLEPRLHERARKDRAELKVEVDEDGAGSLVDTDLTAVEQIVFNLVDNACKYGLEDEGERVITLSAMNGGKTARIEVCDRGGGVARRDVKKLFRPFHKSACDAAHSKPGVGLGLALCRRLARALGGELKLDGQRTEGACFVLELPVVNGK